MATPTLKSGSLKREKRHNHSLIDKNPESNHLVNVEFIEGLSSDQVITTINQLTNPQLIIWYIGCYGLRKTAAQFYEKFLISPILAKNIGAKFWLLDLTAWNALKTTLSSIHKTSSCCDKIDRFGDDRIKCISSASIFNKMQQISDLSSVSYFREALRRKFIHRKSQFFPDRNFCVRDIFLDDCPVMADWYAKDVSKAYSILQYLEGCLLVDEIFTREATHESTNELEIVFALPNDELNYYKDALGSFQKDVQFLIRKRAIDSDIKYFTLKIKFISFKYGSKLEDRPYNAPGPVLKAHNLSYQDIARYSKETKNHLII
ncbi:MAG: hypothetical protein LVR00_00125 [Rhabdochlamydiaceae bacterium]|jgi:hypothetical protein